MALYTDPAAMAPLTPTFDSALENLALRVSTAAARLSGKLHPLTARAVATFLRPMNSYYSNLIEGHNTSPLAIERALKQDFAADRRNRNLQLEAQAHVLTQARLHERLAAAGPDPLNVYEPTFWQRIHQEFYEHLPPDFQQVTTEEGHSLAVQPGELRTTEVKVGRHVAPAAEALPEFVARFAAHYDPARTRSPLQRLVQVAAAHHRFAWIHPFLDGNGRAGRLLSEAALQVEGLAAGGLWSVARGLARQERRYKDLLANADRQRYNDYDGRGNLSEKALHAFCLFFLETALDQLTYMQQVLDTDAMLGRILALAELLTARHRLPREARYVLEEVFLRGQVPRRELPRLVQKSENTARALAETLIGYGLLETGNRFAPYRVAYPLGMSPVLFPGLYPAGHEVEMWQHI